MTSILVKIEAVLDSEVGHGYCGIEENINPSIACRVYRGKLMKIEVKYIYESDYFIISPWKKGKLINIMETIPL